MSEMIERVAKAIWHQRRTSAGELGIELEEWGDGGIPRANRVVEEARAAIEAMREPTEEMKNIDPAYYGRCPTCGGAEEAWPAMIDAALHRSV